MDKTHQTPMQNHNFFLMVDIKKNLFSFYCVLTINSLFELDMVLFELDMAEYLKY